MVTGQIKRKFKFCFYEQIFDGGLESYRFAFSLDIKSSHYSLACSRSFGIANLLSKSTDVVYVAIPYSSFTNGDIPINLDSSFSPVDISINYPLPF